MDDEILEINGRSIEGMTANEVADVMVIKAITNYLPSDL